jgi:hypothetical protein
VIDNPNLNQLFEMDRQSNPNPATIQHLLEKFQQHKLLKVFFEGKTCNSKGKSPYRLTT